MSRRELGLRPDDDELLDELTRTLAVANERLLAVRHELAKCQEMRSAQVRENADLRHERDEARRLCHEAAKHLRNLPAGSELKDQQMWEKLERVPKPA